MRRPVWIFIFILLLTGAAQAQEATETPEAPTFVFEFPLAPATDAQIEEAYACILSTEDTEATPEAGDVGLACELAQQAFAIGQARAEDTTPTDEELDLFLDVVRQNPALIHRLDMLIYYFGATDLIAPPEFSDQPIVELELNYEFGGLGNSVNYRIIIKNADAKPVLTGTTENSDDYSATPTNGGLPLPATTDPALVQAFAPALQDFVPISSPLNIVNCFDYYPDWRIKLTFADDTVVEVVTHGSNLIGIGGPWQMEIDEQLYMQYSGVFQEPVVNLLEALELPLGTTAASYCGGIDDPIRAAFPREATQP
jgi:hypothetical protein